MNLEQNTKVFNVLCDTNTNWKTLKQPLFSGQGLPTETFGLFRSDNNQWLGSVGNRYEVMHNQELAEVMVHLQERFGGEIEGGTLGRIDGQKIFYQMSLKDGIINEDKVKRYITCMNSHDGSSSIGFGSTNMVVSCSNTFHKAMKDLSKFRHTASASERLSFAVREFERALEEDNRLMHTYDRMTEVAINPTILSRVMQNVFNVDMNKKQDEVSPRKLNQVKDFEVALSKETNEKGNTLWGLFNAVTYYTNHMEKKGGKDLNYLMNGGGYKKNLKAFNTIVKELTYGMGV